MAQNDLPAERRSYDTLMADTARRFNAIFRAFEQSMFEPEFQWMTSAKWGNGINVDIREHDDEIIVVADLPGVEKQDIHLRLLDPKVLQISLDHREEREEQKEEYYLRERAYRVKSRSIILPAEVTGEGASNSFRNGVLEVRLKKAPASQSKEIPVE